MLGINYQPFLKDYLQEDAESDIFSNLSKNGVAGINQPVSSNERYSNNNCLTHIIMLTRFRMYS